MDEMLEQSTPMSDELAPPGATTDHYKPGEDGLTRRDHEVLARWWQGAIGRGIQHRKPFIEAYREALRFCYESHDFLIDSVAPDTKFKSTIPKVWEMVNIFGPMLAFKNPHRTARVRFQLPDQPDQQTGQLVPDQRVPYFGVMQRLLNYCPSELGLVDQSREAVDQAIVAGAACMFLERDQKSGLYGHFHEDVVNVVVDPDGNRLEDCWWIARRKWMPRWQFAELAEVDLTDERLPRGNHPNLVADENEPSPELERMRGKTNEIVEVWEVWSKMGLGFRGKSIDPDVLPAAQRKEKTWGDYCHFFVIAGSPYLWNLSDWDLPFYLDSGSGSSTWPMSMLYFRKKADCFWPVSILKAVLGQQKAIDWLATMILNKVYTTSRDFIVTLKQLDKKVQEQIELGLDLQILKLDGLDLADGRKIPDLISFLQHPPMNRDIWETFQMFNEQFERSSGLYSALYGKPGESQERSATAAELHANRADLRPDDMRERVERWHTLMARKEAIAFRLQYDPEFVAKVLGPNDAQVWGDYQRGDLMQVMREADYTVEAESVAKRNLQKEREDSQLLFDRLVQIALGFQDLNAVNKLVDNIQRAYNIPEADRITIAPPPPPPEQRQPDTAEQEEQAAGLKAAQEAEKVRAAAAKADKEEAAALQQRIKAMMEAVAAQGDAPDLSALAQEGPVAIRNGRPVMPSGVGPEGMA